MAFGLLLVRMVVGLLFAGHGVQKLFGWFGGPGREGAEAFLRSLRYRWGRGMAIAHGATETVAGALLALGFLTPLASAMVIGVMLNAIVVVHLPKGVWNTQGGFELPLVYAAAAAGLTFVGPGAWSIDRLIGFSPGPVASGLGAIALGVVAGLIALATRAPAREAAAGRAEGRDEREAA